MPDLPPTTHLLYLHGFRSSPKSFKAQRLQAWLREQRPEVVWCCPQLPPSPAAAWQLMQDLTAAWPLDGRVVVGSSLGGFYATVAAEAWGCPALVMNPAVDPARDLAAYIGEQTAYHSTDANDPLARFFFRAEFIDELRALTPGPITRPGRYAALLAKGDELLDWREMSARYAGARQLVLEGSDHALSDFDTHLPFVIDNLNLRKPSPCV